ncbi:MAG: hypothetical protein M1829_000454 [Trizodia sp. TS-e1964]|nr:MAG: hypothetical protein M1829_000454 [Trizodia sp. TS-e1964]
MASHPLRSFDRKEFLENHFIEEHQGQFIKSRLPTLVEMGSRPSARLFDSCPFCGPQLKNSASFENFELASPRIFAPGDMPRHISGHLKMLGLRFLRIQYVREEESEDDSKTHRSSVATRSIETNTGNTPSLQSPPEFQDDDTIRDFENTLEWCFLPQLEYLGHEQNPQLRQLIMAQNALTDRPETPPSKLFIIPFSRNLNFIDRHLYLDLLHEKCAVPGSRTALVGLGGVGKSQLAIEFSYQVQNHSPEIYVFWVHSTNATQFEQSFREIAEYLGIAGRNDLEADIIRITHDWLQNENNGKWLLILDDVVHDSWFLSDNTLSVLVSVKDSTEKESRSPWGWLPQSPHGSVLITTRNRRVALNLAEERDIITVEPSIKEDAIAFSKITSALGCIPLALAQATKDLNKRPSKHSVREFIKTTPLNNEGNFRQEQGAYNSIIFTWQVSFDRIQQESPSAAELLSLMSFFDGQGIPKGLIQNRDEIGNGYRNLGRRYKSMDDGQGASENSATEIFEADVSVLRDYFFIKININNQNFEMHRLVQLSARYWLEAHNNLERWKQQFIKILWAEFPTSDYKNWEKCRALFPHARLALMQQPLEDDSLKEWALLLYNAAWYARLSGNFSDAAKMSLKSMEVSKKHFGQEDSVTLSSQAAVALIYRDLGRWKEADELFLQVMETSLRLLGQEHPDTLRSMSNFALVLDSQGKYFEAESMGRRVIELQENIQGPEHPDTLRSMINLVLTLNHQGRCEEAEQMNRFVLEPLEKVLGPEHPDTLGSMSNLALVLHSQGKYEEVEDINRRVLELREKVLGPEHPDTLISLSNLALALCSQDQYKEAEGMAQHVIKLQGAVMGPEHPETLRSKSILAQVLTSQDRYLEAEYLNRHIVELQEKILRPQHPDTLGNMSNLAQALYKQDKYGEAEGMYRRIVEIQEKILRQQHPDRLGNISNLAQVLCKQGKYGEAEDLDRRIFVLLLGPRHDPATLYGMDYSAPSYTYCGA